MGRRGSEDQQAVVLDFTQIDGDMVVIAEAGAVNKICDDDEDEDEDADEENTNSKIRKLLGFGLVFIVALTIGLAVGLTSSSKETADPPLNGGGKGPDPCQRVAPDMASQCACRTSPTVTMPAELIANYDNVTSTLRSLGVNLSGDNSTTCGMGVLSRYWIADMQPQLNVLDLIQYYTMVTFYYSLNGPSWKEDIPGWLSSSPLCTSWAGIECNAEGGSVSAITLP